MLLERGVIPNEEMLIGFFKDGGFNSGKSDIKLLQTLAVRGINLSAQDEEGKTILHHFVSSGLGENSQYKDLGEYLMTNVNVDVQDRTRYTALHYAAWGGFEKTAGDLLSAGANRDLQEHTHLTAEKLAHLAAALSPGTQEKYFRIQDMIKSEENMDTICMVQEVSYKTHAEKVEESSESRHR